jgi:hypothetical protein
MLQYRSACLFSVALLPGHGPGIYRSLHYPGFEVGDAQHPAHEVEVLALLGYHAHAIRGLSSSSHSFAPAVLSSSSSGSSASSSNGLPEARTAHQSLGADGNGASSTSLSADGRGFYSSTNHLNYSRFFH